MGDQMEFPETFEKFAEEYGIKDDKEVYTNGSDLIPIFRVKQWLEHEYRWIPVSERLPEDLEPVNITWVNHNPVSYYADIKDKPFTATGVYFNGQWYWWSKICTDILAEYSHNYDDILDGATEVIAWMPLPTPYERQESEE